MALVGSIVVAISSDTSALSKGLAAARSSLSSFASATTGALGKGLSAAQSGLSGLGSALTSVQGLIGGLVGAVSVGAFAGLVKGSLDAMDATGDLAGRVGVTTKELSRLQYAVQLTGSEADDLAPSLQKMNDLLSDAALRGGPTQHALQSIGLSAKDLVKLSPSEAFLKIADGIAGIEDPSHKASTAMAVFGKSGQSLLNSLNAGSGELERLASEADKLGISFDDLAASKAGAANDAIDKFTGVLGGVSNQIAIAVVPYITAAGDAFLKWSADGLNTGSVITKAIAGIQTAITTTLDVIASLVQGWHFAQGAITTIIGVIVKGISYLGSAIDKVTGLVPGLQTSFGQTLDAISNDLLKLGDTQWTEGLKNVDLSSGVQSFFDSLKTSANASTEAVTKTTSAIKGTSFASAELGARVAELTKKFTEEIAAVGKTSEETDVLKLKQLGATDQQLQDVSSLAAQLKELNKQQDLFKDLKESTKSPFEKYAEDLTRLKALLDQGRISADQFAKGVTKVRSEDLKGFEEPKFAGALELGSKEARSEVLKAAYGTQRDTGIESVSKNTGKQVQLIAETNQILRQALGGGASRLELISL